MKILLFLLLINVSFSETRFIIIGDWGKKGSIKQAEVARAMEAYATNNKVDFIATVGDNFYPKGIAHVDDEQWEKSYTNVYKYKNIKDLDWYATFGNHDCLGSKDAQIDYHLINHKWNMPDLFYHKEFEDLELFVLHTSTFMPSYIRGTFKKCIDLPERIIEQKNWFLSNIIKNTKKWKIVLGHHPFFSSSDEDDDSLNLQNLFLDTIRKNANIYASGHSHHLELLKDDQSNLVYLISGAGSEARKIDTDPKSVFAAKVTGFIVVTLKDDIGIVEFVNNSGAIVYTYKIKKR